MTLVDEAIRAEHISSAFTKYRSPNQDSIQGIDAARSELAGLSRALRETDKLIIEDRSDRLSLIDADLRLVHEAITFTLADIWHIIGTIGGKADTYPTPDDFRKSWRKIVRHCRDRGKQELSTRLDAFRRFLLALCRILRDQAPDPAEYTALRRIVRDLVAHNAPPLSVDTEQAADSNNKNSTAPGANGLGTRRSYERQRRNHPMSPSESDSSSPPFSAPGHNFPSPPTSPTNTFSTISQISSIDRELEHWAPRVFKEIPSTTALPTSNARSEYHNVPGQLTHGHPGEDYDEVVALTFPPDPPGLRVSLFCRQRDWRAKMVAQWKDPKGRLCIVCLPLDMLEVYRHGPMLHLCRHQADTQTNLAWLSLKFATIETLVLFVCTFQAMRAHDGVSSVKPTADRKIEGEELEFAGKTRSNSGHSYALRVFRDKASNAVRLLSSVRGGKLDGTPIWTAFITSHLASKTWCQRLDHNVVSFRELKPNIFSSHFRFQRLPNGSFVLKFESKQDAKEFVGRIEQLGKEARRAQH